MKKILLVTILMATTIGVMAQTNYTSSITNPSFESGMTGWTYQGLSTQGNSAFSLKAGNTYIERWTNKGSAVGNASVSQVISGLPAGNYRLTVAAQNIQEDAPAAAQTGTYIYAGQKQTIVTVTADYSVDFDFISAPVEVGFVAVSASGNWIALDNFRLTKVGSDLSNALQEAIAAAKTTLGDASGKKSDQLGQAIAQAETVAANTAATADEQAQAIVDVQEAEGIYNRANASESKPLDLTQYIINPSFEDGNFSGWTQTNFAVQSNTAFSLKQGTYYIEKWTNKGSAVGDASVSQTISGLYPGRYRLRVAAQNIQEDYSTRSQTGTYIFANTNTLSVTTRKQYALTFVLTSTELTIGFRAEGATGNWIALDNFRLEYIGDSEDDIRAAFVELIEKAQNLATQRINTKALKALQTALTAAQSALDSSSDPSDWSEASAALEAAYTTANESAATFAKLNSAIAEAQAAIDKATGSKTEAYQAAVDAAQAVYDNATTTDAQVLAALKALDKAAFAFKIDNGTGRVPTVTTDPRFIKGATWAFGRSTVSGTGIIEQGFCWSESPDPKVTDNRTTEFINQAGRIYWLRDLKPGTMYYMRAYAITSTYAVGYGDVIKFSTVPKGQITHWYNNGGDEATNDRINNAINSAIDYYWNNLSSIHGFGISVTYSPGTPTADCSYGGSMRVGASASYQSTGTIMHESLHGIGVGTHGMWWSGNMRANGDRGVWLGDRVTEAVRFWDNSATATITGDNTHLWPYGCNGAQEDTHSDNLYVMMGIIAQALNEDGLPGSNEIGYALPYYSFTQEDDVKYYIKSEDETYGLTTSYLVENAAHQLVWKEMSAEEAIDDDAAAWYITFTPGNQYYQLRNAKTGYYMTYNSTGTNGFKTARRTSITANDNFHLMRGRVDVVSGSNNFRGYYFIHPVSYTATPTLLTPTTGGKTNTGSFDIAKTATAQRWLILTADEAKSFDGDAIRIAKENLLNITAKIREMAATPHVETTQDADATLSATLDNIDGQANTSNSVKALRSLITEARTAGMDFLEGVSARSVDQPFDLTFLIENPDFKTSATAGWSAPDGSGYGGGAVEYFQKTFNFYQTLSDMPAGTYQLKAQAYQRPGAYTDVYAPWSAGTARVTTYIYIGSTTQTVKHICDDAQKSSLTSDDKQAATGVWIPDNMTGGAQYFAKGLYDNTVEAEQARRTTMRIGIRCTSAPTAYWTMFDNFRLYYYGDMGVVTGVDEIEVEDAVPSIDASVAYDLQGRRVTNPQHGMFIIGGKKVYIK